MSNHASFVTNSSLLEVSHQLWSYWSGSQAPGRFEPLHQSSFRRIQAETLSSWTTGSQRGSDYAFRAFSTYLAAQQMSALQPDMWQWHESPRLESHCARLTDGGLRVASPAPVDVAGVMLLVHELAHAALECAQPGSLANTEYTEQFALTAELFAARWMLSSSNEEYLNLSLAQSILGWLAHREHEFQIQHSVLAEFEWLLWQVANTQTHSVANHGIGKGLATTKAIDTAWHTAHHRAGLTCVPLGWSRIPLILQRPGSAYVYRSAWVKARFKFSSSNLFKEWPCVA